MTSQQRISPFTAVLKLEAGRGGGVERSRSSDSDRHSGVFFSLVQIEQVLFSPPARILLRWAAEKKNYKCVCVCVCV